MNIGFANLSGCIPRILRRSEFSRNEIVAPIAPRMSRTSQRQKRHPGVWSRRNRNFRWFRSPNWGDNVKWRFFIRSNRHLQPTPIYEWKAKACSSLLTNYWHWWRRGHHWAVTLLLLC